MSSSKRVDREMEAARESRDTKGLESEGSSSSVSHKHTVFGSAIPSGDPSLYLAGCLPPSHSLHVHTPTTSFNRKDSPLSPSSASQASTKPDSTTPATLITIATDFDKCSATMTIDVSKSSETYPPPTRGPDKVSIADRMLIIELTKIWCTTARTQAEEAQAQAVKSLQAIAGALQAYSSSLAKMQDVQELMKQKRLKAEREKVRAKASEMRCKQLVTEGGQELLQLEWIRQQILDEIATVKADAAVAATVRDKGVTDGLRSQMVQLHTYFAQHGRMMEKLMTSLDGVKRAAPKFASTAALAEQHILIYGGMIEEVSAEETLIASGTDQLEQCSNHYAEALEVAKAAEQQWQDVDNILNRLETEMQFKLFGNEAK